jgi:hypothetical protein
LVLTEASATVRKRWTSSARASCWCSTREAQDKGHPACGRPRTGTYPWVADQPSVKPRVTVGGDPTITMATFKERMQQGGDVAVEPLERGGAHRAEESQALGDDRVLAARVLHAAQRQ